MNQISLSIDGDNARQIEAAYAFFKVLHEDAPEPKKVEKEPTKKVEKEPTKKVEKEPIKKGASFDDKANEAHLRGEVDKACTKETETATVPSITLSDLRLLVSEKAKINKDAVKAKLTELGAPNTSKLDPEKYEEFVAFLKSLA